ncbi:MAG: HAD-IIIA family hydrolase [Magnetococcales bacterium]|nr:HAD-IIIA family hydrolase [Magnetococcales bacterium]
MGRKAQENRKNNEMDGFFQEIRVRLKANSLNREAKIPGLFLDRDGVIVEEVHYLSRVADVRLQTGAAELIKGVRQAGAPVAVVTNQAGIARGYFTWDDYLAVERENDVQLHAEGTEVDGVIACPFHPQHTPDWNDEKARWRKPGPAMVEWMAEALAVDLSRSWMVGDNASDIGAAKAAGLQGAVHVGTGHGAEFRDKALALAGDGFEVLTAADMPEVGALLLPKYQP